MRNNLAAALLVIVVAPLAWAAPIRDITFTVFPLGNPPTYTVTALAADPSGSKVWFTDQAFAQIGFIELASGAVTKFSLRPPSGESILVIATPQALVFGADGNLWFPAALGSALAGMIGRFVPSTGTVTYFPIPGLSFATITYLALGPDGNVWFTDQSSSRLGKITPAGVVTAVNIAAANGALAQTMKGLAFGADGNAWVTSGARSIFSVPLSGGTATEYRLQGGSFRTPTGITRGPDNNLYFTEAGTTADLGNRIGRITTEGAITEWEIPTANSGATGIATGSDGKLYFTEQSAKQLGQLDPATGVILESPVPNGETPLAIVALPADAPSSRYAPSAEGPKSGIVFNTLPANFRDGHAIWAVIDPGDLRPDPKAYVELTDNLLFPSDPDFYERFRIGASFVVLLRSENVAATAATFGPIEMKSAIPDFATDALAGFIGVVGSCKEESRVVTCTTPTVLLPGEGVTAILTFGVPKLPAGSDTLSFGLFNSIKGGGDVNDTNNFAGRTVTFVLHRDEYLERLTDFAPLAIRTGRP